MLGWECWDGAVSAAADFTHSGAMTLLPWTAYLLVADPGRAPAGIGPGLLRNLATSPPLAACICSGGGMPGHAKAALITRRWSERKHGHNLAFATRSVPGFRHGPLFSRLLAVGGTTGTVCSPSAPGSERGRKAEIQPGLGRHC